MKELFKNKDSIFYKTQGPANKLKFIAEECCKNFEGDLLEIGCLNTKQRSDIFYFHAFILQSTYNCLCWEEVSTSTTASNYHSEVRIQTKIFDYRNSFQICLFEQCLKEYPMK